MFTCLALSAGLLQLAMRTWVASGTKTPKLPMGTSKAFTA